MHQVEHHGLFVVDQRGLSLRDYRVREVQQRRHDLQAGIIKAFLVTQEIDELEGSLIGDIDAKAYCFNTQPDEELVLHLLENDDIFVTDNNSVGFRQRACSPLHTGK